MSADNGQVSILRMWVIQGNILLDCKVQDIFLSSYSSTGVIADVLAF